MIRFARGVALCAVLLALGLGAIRPALADEAAPRQAAAAQRPAHKPQAQTAKPAPKAASKAAKAPRKASAAKSASKTAATARSKAASAAQKPSTRQPAGTSAARPPAGTDHHPAAPQRPARTLEVTATGYASKGDHGLKSGRYMTAFGHRLAPGEKAIAVSRDLQAMGLGYDTPVRIRGLPGEYLVKDLMPPRWNRRIDIYFGHDARAMHAFGTRTVVIEWGSALEDAPSPQTSANPPPAAPAPLPDPQPPAEPVRPEPTPPAAVNPFQSRR